MTADERKALHKELLIAFPKRTDLELLVLLQMGEGSYPCAVDGDHKSSVLYLIQWAEGMGYINNLVCAACEDRPGNIPLRILAVKFGAIPDPGKAEDNHENSDARQLHLLLSLRPIDRSELPACDVTVWKAWGDDGTMETVGDGYGLRLSDAKALTQFLTKCLNDISDDLLTAKDNLILEVFLPDELLGLSVDEWTLLEGDSLGEQYGVVVRPRRRLQRKERWGKWQRKTDTVDKKQVVAADAIEWLDWEDKVSSNPPGPNWDSLRQCFTVPEIPSVCRHVLAMSGTPPRSWFKELVDTLLMTGAFIVLWPRQERLAREGSSAREQFDALLTTGALEKLPHRVRAHRSVNRSTFKATLLWDDVTRKTLLKPDKENDDSMALFAP